MTTPGEEVPRQQHEQTADHDPTLGAINDVTQTLGGTATNKIAEMTMPDTAEGRALQAALVDPPSESLRRQTRELKRKAYHLRQFIQEGAVPFGSAEQSFLDNAFAFSEAAQSEEMQKVLADTRKFLMGKGAVDAFEMQHHADRLVQALTENAPRAIDMADLPLLCRQTITLEEEMLQGASKGAVDRASSAIRQFDHAVIASVVHAVSTQEVLGDGIMPTHEMHRQVFGEEARDVEHGRLEIAQRLIRDRLTISEMVVGASMYSEMSIRGNEVHGTSPYAPQLTPQEANDLNAAAADTLERLHLLRRFGVGSFEVAGETLGLPYDVAVMPPLFVDAQGNPEYAEGAIADFMFLVPTEHTDIELRMTPQGQGVTIVNPGDAQAIMRFRLHDNGDISSGLGYHNTPSDITQRTFEENGCGSAFMRLRALMIGLAFDAVVPDSVVRGPQVQTSVADRLARRPLTPQQSSGRLTDLLLRRRRALQDAGVNHGNPRPRGEEWQGPTRPIDGYRRRLPAGTRRRPEAEQQARDFYASIGVAFDGLGEDENFVNGYNRRAETEVPFRRARFRRDSETRRFMQGVRTGPATPPRRPGSRERGQAALEQLMKDLTPAQRAAAQQLLGQIPRDVRRRF